MSPDNARAFWIVGASQSELRTETLPACPAGSVRIRTRYSGISRGTESLVYRGDVPPDEYARMRAPFQDGDFPAPVKYGYISVGDVEKGPPDLVGRTVFCLHPHQDRYVVPAEAVTPLPDGVPPERAVLAANLETAINGLWDASPGIGDRIAVIGAGAVGCLVAWLAAAIPGTQVELIDTNGGRAALARTLGVDFATPESANAQVDVVIHASGNPFGLDTALRLAGREATIVEMSWYGQRTATLALGAAFHSQRLTIKSSQVGAIPADHQKRWTYRRRLQLALSLLSDSTLDALITGESDFTALPHTMSLLSNPAHDVICHRVHYTACNPPVGKR